MENFGKFCFVLLAILLASIYGGFVFSKLWVWTITPIFSFRPLTVYECIGIMFFIGAFLKTTSKDDDNEENGWSKFIAMLLKSIVLYSLYLGIGYVYFLMR